eukprot:6946431-Alexandrium_andersonii.AAC.1
MTGWGLISPSTAQWLAAGAREDGLEQPDLVKLASIGSSGTYSGNARRDLLRAFCPGMTVPTPISLTLPLQSKDKSINEGPIFILNPSELVQSLFDDHSSVFPDIIGSEPESF